jgi:hypothetical protein
MSNSWLQYPTSSNLLKKSYVKTFIDVSGDVYVRNANVEGFNADISMNGTITCNSLTLTEGVGSGVNGEVINALDVKQNTLTAGSGIDITADVISIVAGGGDSSVTTSSTSTFTNMTLELAWDITFAALQGYSHGNAQSERWGHGARISDDGNTILIGLPLFNLGESQNISAMEAYRKVNGTWSSIGNRVDGDGANNTIPGNGELTINANGEFIAHGSDYDTVNNWQGFIKVYKLVGNNWTQHGNTIRGSVSNAVDSYRRLGKFMKLSADGNTVVSSNNDYYDGYRITVWDLVGSTWTLRANSNLSNATQNNWDGFLPAVDYPRSARFGTFKGNFDMSNDGNTIAIVNTNSNKLAKILVIDYINGDWVRRPAATEMIGTYTTDRYASYIGMTGDGNSIAVSVGTYNHHLGGINHSGGIYVYDYTNGDWVQRGNVIDAPAGGILFGIQMCKISNDGNFVCGMDHSAPGLVQTSHWNGTSWQNVGDTIVSGRRDADFAADAIKFVTGEAWTNVAGSPYNHVNIYALAGETTISTNISENLDISGNLDVLSGDIIVNGSTVHSSDIRVKTNVEKLSNTLTNLLKLNPEIYDKKQTIEEIGGIMIKESGFIAQEIWYNIPELRHLVILPNGIYPSDIQDMSLNRVKPPYTDIYDISTNGFINVDTNKIEHYNEDDTITTNKLLDNNITTSKISDNAVTMNKILDGNITAAKIADGNITSSKMHIDVVDGFLTAGANVTLTKDTNNGIVTISSSGGTISNNAITSAKIASNAVTSLKIADDAITSAKIADGNITSSKMHIDTIDAFLTGGANVTLTKDNVTGVITIASSGGGGVALTNTTDIIVKDIDMNGNLSGSGNITQWTV